MPIKAIKWGAKHSNILVKLYTYFCLCWVFIAFLLCVSVAWEQLFIEFSPVYLPAFVIFFLIFALPPLVPIYMFYHFRGRTPPKVEAKLVITEKILDPYLSSVKEKFDEAESYFKGEKGISWGPVIVLFFDAVMSTLQRLIIDTKGIKPIEQMRKDRKLFFDSLVSVLRTEEGILESHDLKNLEMLRDLRNRVVHEDYRPSRKHAIWASKISRAFISKKYPEVF